MLRPAGLPSRRASVAAAAHAARAAGMWPQTTPPQHPPDLFCNLLTPMQERGRRHFPLTQTGR